MSQLQTVKFIKHAEMRWSSLHGFQNSTVHIWMLLEINLFIVNTT